MKTIVYTIALISTLLLTGCNEAGNPNHPPHAVATVSSQTVEEGESVTFDGSSSSDSDGEIVSYKWITASGETLSSISHFSHVFTAPGVQTITLEVKDNDGEANSTSVTVTVNTPADTTAPVITLIGDANVTLSVGDVYTDAGATATDDKDGNVSVTTTGRVDTGTAGTYTVTYTAIDEAGNVATASRTVTVIQAADTIKPVITLNGDANVTLSVGDVYTDAGATATDDKDGNITSKIQTISTVDTTTAGIYTVTYDVNDSAGNAADRVSRRVDVVVAYGKGGSHPVAHHDEVDSNKTTVYYPTDIPNGTKVPVVFFASGYNSTDSKDYETLMTFIASHGYYVIYSKQNKHGWNDVFDDLDKMLDDANGILPKIDTTRIGVMGHSLGGGYTFNILKHFSDMGYGDNGRFIMALEAYYAYNLTKEEMQNLPANTNVIMQQYGTGGNNAVNDTDPRITLTEFYMLDSIPKSQKDWQIVEDADHHYPYGSGAYSTMQGILKPLDALMEWTFKGTASAHDIALEVGSDDPYKHGNGPQVVNPTADYTYKCDKDPHVAIDYCDMAQWYE